MILSLPRNSLSALLLVAMIIFMTSTVSAQETNTRPSAQNLTRQINTLLNDGNHTEALPLIRDLNRFYPGNAKVLYNLACAENSEGNTTAALNALKQATTVGFDDFRQAQKDPDLLSLAGEPGFLALMLENERTVSALSSAQAFTIGKDSWSEFQTMSQTGLISSDMQVRMMWQQVGLLFEIKGSLPDTPNTSIAQATPWAGGDAVFVSVSIPNMNSTWESDNSFHFAFGNDNGIPTGALYLGTQKQWQQIEELSPKVSHSINDNSFQYSFTIPWKVLEPFHPLVDTTLGLNVSVRQASSSGSIVHTLIKDPAAFTPLRSWHRYAPVTFDLTDIKEATVMGRLSHSISSNRAIFLDLMIISPTAGPATLRIDFLDRDNFSVLDEVRNSMTMDLNEGTNNFTWPVDFSSLRTGPYLVNATVDFPGGESLNWETPILHLQPGWIPTVSKYLDNIPLGEKATATLTIDTLQEAIPELKNRRNPQAIGKTLFDLLAMADHAQRYDSILPEEGSFVLAFNDLNNEQHLCSVFFPPGYRQAAELLPIVMLNNYRGFELRMADRMGRFYEYWANAPKPDQRSGKTVPIYIIPHQRTGVLSINQGGSEDALKVTQWAADFFATPSVAAVGIDACLGDALALPGSSDTPLAALLLVAGRNVRIWPEAQPEFLAKRLPVPPYDLPVKWLSFPYETATRGQAPDILLALQNNGWNIIQAKPVKGALGITQVTDRIILWAENLH